MKKRLLNIFKKFALISFVLLLSFFAFSKKTAAFETPSLSYPLQFEEAISGTDAMNLQSFVNETMKAVGASILRFITGTFFSFDPSEIGQAKNSSEPGLLSAGGMIIAGIYTSPPASGVQYLADLGQKLKIVKPAFADDETFGFSIMKTTQPIWRTFRNITYILFVLILIVMGFAIMFRVKISPQAVITFQTALPRVIIALILITFSYAIVGLIIDIGIYLSGLIANIFKDIAIQSHLPGINILINVDEWAVSVITPGPLQPLTKPIGMALLYATSISALFLMLILLTPGIGIILTLIIGLLLLIAFFRTIWTLIKAFAMVVINLVFAPFRILIGVLPGSSAITDWLKDVVANVAVFPAILAMFFVGTYLIAGGIMSGIGNTIENVAGLFGPEEVSFWEKLGEAIGLEIFNVFIAMLFPLIGIMIIFLIPKISEIIQSFITKKPFAFGTAMGQTFAPVTTPTKWGLKFGQDIGTTYLKQRIIPQGSVSEGGVDKEKSEKRGTYKAKAGFVKQKKG